MSTSRWLPWPCQAVSSPFGHKGGTVWVTTRTGAERWLGVGASAGGGQSCRIDSMPRNAMIWSQVEVGSCCRNSGRRVVTNSPWRLVDYWKMTRELSVADWTFEAPR
jgi:hypothetical protein